VCLTIIGTLRTSSSPHNDVVSGCMFQVRVGEVGSFVKRDSLDSIENTGVTRDPQPTKVRKFTTCGKHLGF
jgi:hypothetical protein